MFVERENIIPRKRIPVGKREKPSVSKAYSPYDYNSINEGFSLLKYYLRMFNDNENQLYAGVVKLVDTSDLSSDAQCMRVRFPPPVPLVSIFSCFISLFLSSPNASLACIWETCRCSLMVERQPSKLQVRVQFSPLAPQNIGVQPSRLRQQTLTL